MTEQALSVTSLDDRRLKASDPTNAERQRRFRAKRRKQPDVTPSSTAVTARTPVKSVTALRNRIVCGAALVATVALASVSAYFGVIGMTSIFAAATVPIMILTGALEAGKLVTTAWLARHWEIAPLILRLPLVAVVLALMALSAVGSYGFLSRAHLGHQALAAESIDRDAAPLTEQIALADMAIQDFNVRIRRLDDMVAASTSRGYVKTATVLLVDQSRNRADLVAQRQSTAQRLGDLKVESSAIDARRARLAAENGPATYLAALFGSANSETVVRLAADDRGFVCSAGAPTMTSTAILTTKKCPARWPGKMRKHNGLFRTGTTGKQ